MRVAKSLPAKPIIPKIAKMENRLKPSVPGRIISKTPMKPTIIAVHLRQPTFSPRKKHSPHYHNKRVDCKIADALVIGIRAIARA